MIISGDNELLHSAVIKKSAFNGGRRFLPITPSRTSVFAGQSQVGEPRFSNAQASFRVLVTAVGDEVKRGILRYCGSTISG